MKCFTFFIFLCLFYGATALTAQEQSHVIQKGETLYSLARRYGFSVDEICTFNEISDATKVKVGQQLKIPAKKVIESSTAEIVPAKPVQIATEEYIVQSGDTFYSLARKHRLSVADLLSLNKLATNAVLKTGQRLLMPKLQTTMVPVLPPIPDTSIALTDPRKYENRKVDTNIIWPLKTTEIVYATGKTFSVVLTAEKGDKISAIKSGFVIFSGMYRGFGQVVFIHSQSTGHIYVYSGLENVAVSKNQKVNFGDTLGTLGIDTISNKAQLNFMVYYNGKPVDPAYVPRG